MSETSSITASPSIGHDVASGGQDKAGTDAGMDTSLNPTATNTNDYAKPTIGAHRTGEHPAESQPDPMSTAAGRPRSNAQAPEPLTGRPHSNAQASEPLQRKPNTSSHETPTTVKDPGEKPKIEESTGDAKSSEGQLAPPSQQPVVTSSMKNKVLSSGRYVIQAFLWTTDQGMQSQAGILSQTLQKTILAQVPGKTANDITMATMRKLLTDMSSRLHKFCMADGSIVADETIGLADYLALDHPPMKAQDDGTLVADATNPAATDDDPTPKLNVYYRTSGLLSKILTPPSGGTVAAPTLDLASGLTATDAQVKPVSAPAELVSKITDATLGPNLSSGARTVTAGNLTEEQWDIVLRNCAVFYGWKVDPQSGVIFPAPQAAFQLRTRNEFATTEQTSAFVTKATSALPPSPPSVVLDFDDVLGSGLLPSEAYRAKESLANSVVDGPTPSPSAPDQVQWSAVQLMRKRMPNFRINDNSRIEITQCAHSLAVSMAKNDFSSQSTEASVSGGAFGVTVGASAGFAKSESNDHSSTSTSSTQTLVARYMFPRCDIILRAEDLEPTPELAALLEQVRVKKSINALRTIQQRYGQLFCQELTLGARLLSTKTMTVDEQTDSVSRKEEFKVSVGVSVSTPYGGASVKHEESKGSSEAKSTVTTTSQESNVFEAVGGDTILANNPSAWCSTVGDPNTWRVVNRDGLSTLVEMISQMPNYGAVQRWYVQVIPALSKYVTLDDTYKVVVRFKVQSPLNSLSIPNYGNSVYYLGSISGGTVTPRFGVVNNTVEMFWLRVETENSKVLFSPATYRAPAIHGFVDYKVGDDGVFGTAYNAQYAGVEWNMIAPFAVEDSAGTSPNPPDRLYPVLAHGSRVIMQTVSFKDPKLVLKPGDKDPTPPPCHMVVFRNAQGNFVPAMSDHDEYQYWRILKVGGTVMGEPLKGGDTVRLAWFFEDQVTGFRDFVDDVFGRRCMLWPTELKSTALYLKVPWPRFEIKNSPTALIMSTEADTVHCSVDIPTAAGNFKYLLQDLQFRLDIVYGGPQGDADDFMLRGVAQEGDIKSVTVASNGGYSPKSASNPLQMWASVFGFGIMA